MVGKGQPGLEDDMVGPPAGLDFERDQTLFGLARIQWAPTEADWWRAGLLIRELGATRHWDPHKRMAFQNDVLIALTARRHGATIVTANRSDFEILGRELGIAVLPV